MPLPQCLLSCDDVEAANVVEEALANALRGALKERQAPELPSDK